MKLYRKLIYSAALLLSTTVSSQETGAQKKIKEINPFSKYFGVWKLKAGEFKITSADNIETVLAMPEHTTSCDKINTDKSILCKITAKGLAGHVLWSFDSTSNEMHHLSHFGPIGQQLNAVGAGDINEHGNIRSKVSFENQSDGYYNTYEYTWVSNDEYTMHSREFDNNDSPTGAHYSAVYIRK
ncbi:MAG: hypothetical protein KTR16_00440 [Acidiferrobacterales bacterium]|nr:hypothetical protein [Acidiferrobacterales bacterium]